MNCPHFPSSPYSLMQSPKTYPEGNELSRCGQSTQGLRKTTAPNREGFLEFSLEDWVTWNPLRNGSVSLSSSGPFAAGACIWLQPHLLRDFDVRVTGFRAQLCRFYLLWCWTSCLTSLSLGKNGSRTYLRELTKCKQDLSRAQEKCSMVLMLINKNQAPVISTSLLLLPWSLSLLILTFVGNCTPEKGSG